MVVRLCTGPANSGGAIELAGIFCYFWNNAKSDKQ